MSLNHRAFQPRLSPSIMGCSQLALWSWLLFLVAGFKNNCPAPFVKTPQLDNDLVCRVYLSVTELGNDKDLFAHRAKVVRLFLCAWRGLAANPGDSQVGAPVGTQPHPCCRQLARVTLRVELRGLCAHTEMSTRAAGLGCGCSHVPTCLRCNFL